MIAYIEPNLELGFGIFPWLHAAVTLGYQMIGNCFPGAFFGSLFHPSFVAAGHGEDGATCRDRGSDAAGPFRPACRQP